MKKIIIMICLLVSCYGFSFAADWYWVGSGVDGTQYYVDNSSVEKNEQGAVIWVKMVHPDGSYRVSQEAYRRNKVYAMISTAEYDSAGNYLDGASIPYNNPIYLDWTPIPPESMAEAYYFAIWPY